MSMNAPAPHLSGAPILDKPISIAILAMGGQGGGVLSDWIVSIAESQGWAAQSTSVPGVAQRTGATIYYVEMMPPLNGLRPVFSLMPTPGDVDIVLAAEFMEAGRAILRGFVNPKQTVLIASNHRSYAVVEKQVIHRPSSRRQRLPPSARSPSTCRIWQNARAPLYQRLCSVPCVGPGCCRSAATSLKPPSDQAARG
jgi:hypothetical protein